MQENTGLSIHSPSNEQFCARLYGFFGKSGGFLGDPCCYYEIYIVFGNTVMMDSLGIAWRVTVRYS